MGQARCRNKVSLKPTVPTISAWGLVVLLGLTGCGKSTVEPVVPGAKSAGEMRSTMRSMPPPVQIKVAPPQAAVGGSPVMDTARQERQVAEAAQWEQWYATARESLDVSVRLQALETWAQQPNNSLDPVTYGLVDLDESVRQRAQQLYEQHLAREKTGSSPAGEEHKLE